MIDTIKSKMARSHFEMVGFTANKKKRKYSKTVTSKDGLMEVTYSAPLTCGVKEMKAVYTLVHSCIGEAGKDMIEHPKQRAWVVSFDLRKAAKIINNKTTIQERKGIFESLGRIMDMTIDVVKKSDATEGNTQHLKTKWVFEIKTADNYETAEVVVSKSFINIINKTGVGFDLKELMHYDGRTALLYAGTRSYQMNKHGKWMMQNQVNHEWIVKTLELEGYSAKDTNKHIREAFTDMGESFYKRGDWWVKQKAVSNEKVQ